MKRLLIAMLIVLTLALAAGCSSPQVTDPSQPMEVRAGSEFRVVLESNPTTGYHWEIIGPLDESVAQFVSSGYQADQPGAIGSGGKDVWTFRAVAAGKTQILMGYFPPSKVAGEPAQRADFTVIVK